MGFLKKKHDVPPSGSTIFYLLFLCEGIRDDHMWRNELLGGGLGGWGSGWEGVWGLGGRGSALFLLSSDGVGASDCRWFSVPVSKTPSLSVYRWD